MENGKKVNWNRIWKISVAATSSISAILSILSFGMTYGPLFF